LAWAVLKEENDKTVVKRMAVAFMTFAFLSDLPVDVLGNERAG
jgi:hypothetical protein